MASQFDDDGMLDVWVYDNEFTRLPSVTERDFENYVNREILFNDSIHKFGRNDEPPVMFDVMTKYLKEEPSRDPAFIVFINDGGCKSTIKNRLSHLLISRFSGSLSGLEIPILKCLKILTPWKAGSSTTQTSSMCRTSMQ